MLDGVFLVSSCTARKFQVPNARVRGQHRHRLRQHTHASTNLSLQSGQTALRRAIEKNDQLQSRPIWQWQLEATGHQSADIHGHSIAELVLLVSKERRDRHRFKPRNEVATIPSGRESSDREDGKEHLGSVIYLIDEVGSIEHLYKLKCLSRKTCVHLLQLSMPSQEQHFL